MLYHNKYRIESARCPKWDYSSPGYYFITIITHDRRHIFGEIAAGKMRLNQFGEIADDEWHKTDEIRDTVVLDEFVVMPNHIHGIIRILNPKNHKISPKLDNPHDLRCCSRDVARYVSTDEITDGIPDGAKTVTESIDFANYTNIPLPPVKSPIKIAMSAISPVPESLSTIIRSFKSAITRRINILRKTPGVTIFQPRFHDRIIRDKNELFGIRQYIRNNPANWSVDNEFNDNTQLPPDHLTV